MGTLRPLKVCAAFSPPSQWLFLLSPLASFKTQMTGPPPPPSSIPSMYCNRKSSISHPIEFSGTDVSPDFQV